MINKARAGVGAALLSTGLLVGGCMLCDDTAVGPQRLSAAPHHTHTAVYRSAVRKPVRRVHVARASNVVTGALPDTNVRQFCDERHVRFQAGKLSESPEELNRNNETCRQIYESGGADMPNDAAAPR